MRRRLIEIPDLCVKSERRVAAERFYRVHDRFHERRFSAAVLTDYSDFFPFFDNGIHLSERSVVAKDEFIEHDGFFHRFAFGLEVCVKCSDIKIHRRADLPYALDLFEFCLRHSGFICFIAESFDKRGEPVDFFFPHNRVLESLVVRLLFLRHKRGIIAAISLRFAVFDFTHDVDDFIEEHAVVRHDDARFFICAQIVFEPFDSVEVEVVCRLVQKQHVGF